jgi:hypothetical protein
MFSDIQFISFLNYTIRAVLLITAGIILVNLISETGVMSKFKIISVPLCRISGLSEEAVLSILSMVINPTAGKSMLAEYHRAGKVEKEEIVPSLIIGTFPAVFGESIFRAQFPTAVVILGPVLGGIYTFFNLFSTMIQVIGALIYTNLVIRRKRAVPEKEYEKVETPEKLKRPDMKSLKLAIERSKKPLKKIIPITIITMIVFWLLSVAGILNWLSVIFDPILNLIGLPGEASAALLAQFMHFSAGYTVVGSMVDTGMLDFGQALVTLILGSMILITMIYLKYSVPLYIGMFGKDGIRVAVIAYAASMTAKVICIAIVMAIFF